MSLEGVWKVEMLGPYGWENVSTAFMVNGRYYGASAEHYSSGRYEQDGDTIKVLTTITQHGKKRTLFGMENVETLDMRIEGSMDSDGRIAGKVYATNDDSFHIHVRFTRLGDLT